MISTLPSFSRRFVSASCSAIVAAMLFLGLTSSIFRVSGNFNVGNSTIRVAGGVTPNHVLWYFPNTSTLKSPNGAWDGTILALNSPVQFDNTPNGLGFVHGAIIASDDVNNNQNWVFSVVSGFDIIHQPFTNVVPEPTSLYFALLTLGAITFLRRRYAKGLDVRR